MPVKKLKFSITLKNQAGNLSWRMRKFFNNSLTLPVRSYCHFITQLLAFEHP
jgi:hypothetical protein